MKMLLKKREFNWANNYNTFDEQGKTQYIVKGDEANRTIFICNAAEEQVACIVNRSGSKLELYIGDREVGTVKKAFALFKTKIAIELRDWEADGRCADWEYTIRSRAWGEVGKVEKKIWKDIDCYAVEVKNPDLSIDALMVVLSIEALLAKK